LPVAENRLNQQFSAAHPNQVWVTDITYIPTQEGWLYLAGVKDLGAMRPERKPRRTLPSTSRFSTTDKDGTRNSAIFHRRFLLNRRSLTRWVPEPMASTIDDLGQPDGHANRRGKEPSVAKASKQAPDDEKKRASEPLPT
jgi:hypothetical protein